MTKLIFATAIALAACGKRAGTESRTYVLDKGRSDVHVSLVVPTSWKQEVDALGNPDFDPDHELGLGLGVTTFPCPSDSTPDACLALAVKAQFGQVAQPKIEAGANGSQWVIADHVDPTPKLLHMRRFVPVPARHLTVMCIGMLSGAGIDQASALRATCDSLVVQP